MAYRSRRLLGDTQEDAVRVWRDFHRRLRERIVKGQPHDDVLATMPRQAIPLRPLETYVWDERPPPFYDVAVEVYRSLGDDPPPVIRRVRSLIISLLADARAYLDTRCTEKSAASIQKRLERVLEAGLRDPNGPLIVALFCAVASAAAWEMQENSPDGYVGTHPSLGGIYDFWPSLRSRDFEQAFLDTVGTTVMVSRRNSHSKWKAFARLFKAAGIKGFTAVAVEQRYKRYRSMGLLGPAN